MKKSNCYKRCLHYIVILMVSMAFFLLAGCGNKNMQKDNSLQKNQNSQSGSVNQENQDSQSGTVNQENQDSQSGAVNQENQDSQSGSVNQDGQASSANQSSQAGTVNQPKIAVEEAKEAAVQHAGLTSAEVTFVKEELDYDDGKTEYDIEFVTSTTKYEYEINAADGAVLSSSQEPVEQIPENLLGQGVISVEQAKEAVLNHAGFTPEQVAYTKVELEQDDGAVQYEIEFYADGKEYSSTVNGATGAIMEYGME